jgi:putative transposase
MEISDARKLKALEEENRKLKKLLAETMLDASTLKEMLGKTSNAQLAQTRCDLGDPREGLFAAARLSPGWPGSEDLSLCDKAVWR